MRALALVWAFLKREALVELSSPLSLALQALNIAITLSSYFFLSRYMDGRIPGGVPAGEEYFPFVLIGMAANGALISGLTGLSRSLQAQRSSGLLKPLLLGGVHPAGVALASSIYPGMRALVDLGLYLFLGWALGGISLDRANLPAAAGMALLAAAAFAALGIWAATFSIFFRMGNPVLWVISSASWLLGGVFYPTAVLPQPLAEAARLLPLTSALEGLRAALLGGGGAGDAALAAAWLAAFTAVETFLGLVFFGLGLERARVHGTLSPA